MSMYPVRAAIFPAASDALNLVTKLREEGFTWKEVSVICSDETKSHLFPELIQKEPTGATDNPMLRAAGAGALGLGGIAAVAAILSTAGTAVMIMGAFAGIATAGTFASLMATRGFESEATDYYEQAVQEGNVLVAVEVTGDTPLAEARRHLATQLMEDCGAQPLILSH